MEKCSSHETMWLDTMRHEGLRPSTGFARKPTPLSYQRSPTRSQLRALYVLFRTYQSNVSNIYSIRSSANGYIIPKLYLGQALYFTTTLGILRSGTYCACFVPARGKYRRASLRNSHFWPRNRKRRDTRRRKPAGASASNSKVAKACLSVACDAPPNQRMFQ